MSRSTRNSQDAAYFAPCSTTSSHGSTGSSSPVPLSQSDVVGANSSTVAVTSALDQPSPEFLATVVQAVKQALAADQAPVSQVTRPGTSGLAVCAVNSSATSCSFGGVSGLALGSQASALLTAGSGFSSQSSVAQSPSSSGRPAVVVPSFVSTFAPLTSSLVSSRANSSVAFTSQASLASPVFSDSLFPSFSAPNLLQPFVVGPGFSPIPAKLVSQITSGKFVELSDLLASNLSSSEPEPQLLFDGRLVFTSTPKKAKKRIEDIVSWMEAFSIFSLVLVTHFPHRWKDLCQYQLLILRTFQQFGNRVWLAYDRAFREHAAASNLVDWSEINVQLFNFHAAGALARGPQDSWTRTEPSGSSLAQIICKSWNRGRCSAPTANCRFAHRCSSCSGSHRATQCLGMATLPPREATKRRSSSPAPPPSGSKSKRT